MTEGLPSPAAGSTSPWWYTSAAILAAVLAGGYALTLRTHINFLDQAIREGRAQTQAAQRQLTDVQGQLQRARAAAAQAPVIGGILSSTDLVRVDLTPPDDATGGPVAGAPAAGRAFWSASTGLVFAAAALPPLPTTEAYQLWADSGAGQLHSIGVLSRDPGGRAILAAQDLAGAPARFAVTIEPAGGASSTGGRRVLAGSR
jgi:anti-sigma-K factor RskA